MLACFGCRIMEVHNHQLYMHVMCIDCTLSGMVYSRFASRVIIEAAFCPYIRFFKPLRLACI